MKLVNISFRVLHFLKDDNHGKSICRLLHILAQFSFATSQKELDYYHQKMSIRVAAQVAERFIT